MALFEIAVRHRQEAEKDQRVYDEQHAEAGIPPTEVGDAGRHQRDGKTEMGNGKWSLKMKLMMLNTMTARTRPVAIR
jgi:hypothetical protein